MTPYKRSGERSFSIPLLLNYIFKRNALIGMLLLILFALPAYAIPSVIDFQGKLTDSNNNPQTGVFNMTFSVYAQSSGGPVLWRENKLVSVSNGLFSTMLGSNVPLNLTFTGDYYVEIMAGSEVFAPRYRIGTVPYAFRANFSSYAMTDNTTTPSFIVKKISGQTSDLTQWLNEVGNLIAGVNINGQFLGDGSLLSGIGVAATTRNLSAGNISGGTFGSEFGAPSYIFPKNLTVLYNFSAADIFFVSQLLGRVGIGTAAPAGTLHINSSESTGALRVESTTGSSLLFVNGTSGNVGIGTASPTSKLQVTAGNDASNYQITVLHGSGGSQRAGINFGIDTTNLYQLYADNSDGNKFKLSYNDLASTFLTVDTSGNVGIGTTSPQTKLDVSGTLNVTNITLANNCANGQGLKWSNGVGQCGAVGNVSSVGSTGYIPQFQDSTTLNNSVIFQNGTNVGIGTTVPTTLLTLRKAIDSGVYGAGTRMIDFKPYYPPAYDSEIVKASIYAGISDVGTLRTDNGYLAFLTANTAVLHEWMRIETNGNVGIGTTGPQRPLDVAGLSIFGSGGNNNEIMLRGTGSTLTDSLGVWHLSVRGDTGGNNDNFKILRFVGGALQDIPFVISNSNGNVGIGTTSPGEKLSVEGNISFGDILNSYNWQLVRNPANNNLEFSNRQGGAYTKSVTFGGIAGGGGLNVLTGNVGIGTTVPSAKLDVSGTIRAMSAAAPTTGAGVEIIYTGGAGQIYAYDRDATSEKDLNLGLGSLYLKASDGNVGIGTTNPGYKLDVSGDIRTTGNIFLSSTLDASGNLTGQKESRVNSANVPGAGWYRVAQLGGLRGQNTVTVYTTGGSYAPRSTTIRWWHDWSVTGGLNIISEYGDNIYWSQARVTDDGGVSNSFLEVYFTQAISGLELSMQYEGGQVTGTLYSGTLSAGGGSVRMTTPTGAFAINNKLIIDPSGNVGIGTTTPQVKLHTVLSSVLTSVPAAGTYGGAAILGNDLTSYGLYLGAISNGNAYIQAQRGDSATTYNLLIQPNGGNVGIGTTPSYKLDVAGNMRVAAGDSSYTYYGPDASWSGSLYVGATTTKAAASTAAVISTDGNLHLDAGTNKDMYLNYYATGRPIHVYGAMDSGYAITAAQFNTAGWLYNSGRTGMYSQTYGNHLYWSDASYLRLSSNNGMVFGSSTGYDSALAGYIYHDASGFGLLNSGGGWSIRTAPGSDTIYMPGSVGIGTESPGQKLDVNGYGIFGNSAYTYIYLRDDESTSGPKSIHANSNVAGFLNGAGSWMAYWDNSGNMNNAGTISGTGITGTSYVRSNGNVYTDANYGYGLVGVYASTRYQGVFAMSGSYVLAADGTTPGNLYGIAWTHTNVGGESKAGLGHQALFMTNGITQTAIGTGIWTIGGATITGGLTAGSASVGTGVSGTGSGTGVYGTGGSYGFYGISASYGVYGNGGVWGVYGTGGGTGGGYGILGASDTGVYGNGGHGVTGYGITYDFYAVGPGTNYGPFTGSHEAILASDFPADAKPGMIVSTTGEVKKREGSLSSTLPTIQLTDTANDNKVFGVYTMTIDLPSEHWYKQQAGEHTAVVNALGDGRVWVTDYAGEIRNGDRIISSPIAGYGMKEDGRYLLNYVVAKITEDIDWSNVTETVEYGGATYKAYLAAGIYDTLTMASAPDGVYAKNDSGSIDTTSPQRALHVSDVMRLEPRASAPTSPASGDIYVDSTPSPDELCFYDGSAWQGLSSGTDANCA